MLKRLRWRLPRRWIANGKTGARQPPRVCYGSIAGGQNRSRQRHRTLSIDFCQSALPTVPLTSWLSSVAANSPPKCWWVPARPCSRVIGRQGHLSRFCFGSRERHLSCSCHRFQRQPSYGRWQAQCLGQQLVTMQPGRWRGPSRGQKSTACSQCFLLVAHRGVRPRPGNAPPEWEDPSLLRDEGAHYSVSRPKKVGA
jgi:hypothetical protein